MLMAVHLSAAQIPFRLLLSKHTGGEHDRARPSCRSSESVKLVSHIFEEKRSEYGGVGVSLR